MAMKSAAILALASLPFAQTNRMGGDIDGSSMLASMTPAANSDTIITATSGSTIDVTNPAMMATHNRVGAHISSNTRVVNGSSMPTYTYTGGGITAVVGSSVTTSCPAVTHTAAMPSIAEKHSMTIMNMGAMGTGGMNKSNISVTTSQPFHGNGVVTGVSIGLFLLSAALTALLQM
ncbi:hypothetical protein F4825DRAFT_433295 [Nemania diffusa]|nr:hypothetical protein F4825DRAFT_433295 [Nemania diffusa]